MAVQAWFALALVLAAALLAGCTGTPAVGWRIEAGPLGEDNQAVVARSTGFAVTAHVDVRGADLVNGYYSGSLQGARVFEVQIAALAGEVFLGVGGDAARQTVSCSPGGDEDAVEHMGSQAAVKVTTAEGMCRFEVQPRAALEPGERGHSLSFSYRVALQDAPIGISAVAVV